MGAAGASSARSGCVGGYVHLSVDPLVGVFVCAGVCVCARPPSLPSYTHPQIMLGLAQMSGLQSKGRGDDNILGRLLLPLSSVDFKHFLCSLFWLLFFVVYT